MVTQRWASRVTSLMLFVPIVYGNVSPQSLKDKSFIYDPPDSANSTTVVMPNDRILQECNFPIHNGSLFSKVFHNGDQWYEAGYGAIEVFWSFQTCQLVFGKNLGMFDPVNDNAFTYSGGTIRMAFGPQEVQKALDGGAFLSSVNEFYIRITTKYQLRNLSKNGFAYINRRTPETKGYTLSSSFANIHQRPGGGNNPPFSLCTNNKVNDRDIPEADFVLCHDKQCTHDISSGAWSFVDCHVMVSDCYNAMLESCVQQTINLRQFYPIGSFPEYRSFRRQYNVFVFFAGEDMTGGSYPTPLEDRFGSSGEVIMGHHEIPYDDQYGNGKYEVQFTIKRQDSAEISNSAVLGYVQVYSWASNEVLQTLDFTASMVPVGSQWVNITTDVLLTTDHLDDIGFGVVVNSGDQKIVYRSVRVTYLNYETFAPTSTPSQMPSLPVPNNFALYGTTEQSCDDSTYYHYKLAPIDGVTSVNGYYHPGTTSTTGRVSITCKEDQAWWKVRLRNLVEIRKIVIYNRMDAYSERLGDSDVSIIDASFKTVDTRYIGNSDEVAIFEFDFDPGTIGLEVKIQLRGNNYLSLAQVQVWGFEGPPMPTIDMTDYHYLILRNYDNYIYEKRPSSALTRINGRLIQISFDPVSGKICGANKSSRAYCSTKDYYSSSNYGSWHRLDGYFDQIVIQNNLIFALDSNGNLVRQEPNGSWDNLHGSLTFIHYDHVAGIVCGCTDANALFCIDDDAPDSNGWFQLPLAWRYVHVRNGKMYAISADDELYFNGNGAKNPNWIKLPGPNFRMISYDGDSLICGFIYGTGSADYDIYCADTLIDSAPVWVFVNANINIPLYMDVVKATPE